MQDHIVVAIITFMVTGFGTFANVLVFIIAGKISSMNSSFGVITKNQAVCNALMCLVFLVYVFPLQISPSPFFIEYSHFGGLAAMTADEVSNFSHLLIAVNRFCAVFLPSYYEKLFSKFGTKVMCSVIWIGSVVGCLILYELIGCHLVYDENSWLLVFIDTPECTQLTWFSDFTLNISLAVMTLVTNLVTAFQAGRKSRMLVDAAGIKISKQQRQRELNFIKQSFFQGMTVFTGQVTYYIIAPSLTNPVIIFIFGSLWAFMHALEGGIILLSNQEMRGVLKTRKRKQSTVFISRTSLV